MSSVIGDSRALEHRLNSCGTWDLPRSGIELTCPELEGGFFTTEPPGKPEKCVLKVKKVFIYFYFLGQYN